jgi:glucose/arabinose dehydrogenase
MRRAAGALVLAALLAACVEQEPGLMPDDDGTTTATGTPTTTASPSPTDTGSAPDDGPPRVVDTVATGLEVPWGIDFLPSGDAVVTERDSARVLLLDPGTGRTREVGVLEETEPTSEGGLLGVAVSPDFASDRRLFFYVTTAEDNRIVSAQLRGGSLGPVTEVLTGIPVGQNHDGGRLEFGPDGFLHASTGEVYEPGRAQDRDDLGGKILRMTTEGEPAPGNPFGTVVWSWGHRNVQGLAWVGDQLWASEFGADAWDELNRIEAGGNYGWPDVEGRGGAPDYVDPQRVWRTGEASPSGLAYADGALWMAALRGDRLWRIPVDGQEAGEPQDFLVGEYGRLRTVVVAPDGNLWVTTSNHDGRGTPQEGDDRILVVRP